MRKVLHLLLPVFLAAGISAAGTAVCFADTPQTQGIIQMAAEEETADIEAKDRVLRRENAENTPSETEAASGEEGTSGPAAEETSAEQMLKTELEIAESLDGIAIPEEAEQITYTYHGNVIAAAKTSQGLYLLPVVEEGSISWYVYDEETDEAIPYAPFGSTDSTFVIVPAGSSVEIPKEFAAVRISAYGHELPAWRNPLVEDDNLYYVYALDNATGETGLYRFDGINGAMLRYIPDVTEPETTEPEPQTQDPEILQQLSSYKEQESIAIAKYQELKQETDEDLLYRTLIIIGLVAFSLILLLIVIILSSKLRRKRRDEEEEEEAHYSDSGIRVKPRDRRDEISYEDTRAMGREEGTSAVRTARRRAQEEDYDDYDDYGYDEEAFNGRRSDSGKRTAQVRERRQAAAEPARRRPIYDEDGQARRRPAYDEDEQIRRRPSSDEQVRRRPAYDEDEQIRRRPAYDEDEQVRRRPSSDEASRRRASSDEQARRRPASDEAPARRRPAVRPEESGNGRRQPSGKAVSPQKKRPVRDEYEEELWKDAETQAEDVTVDFTASGQEEEPAAGNMTESVKVAARQKAVEPLVENLFEDESDENDDFDITDFKNI